MVRRPGPNHGGTAKRGSKKAVAVVAPHDGSIKRPKGSALRGSTMIGRRAAVMRSGSQIFHETYSMGINRSVVLINSDTSKDLLTAHPCRFRAAAVCLLLLAHCRINGMIKRNPQSIITVWLTACQIVVQPV